MKTIKQILNEQNMPFDGTNNGSVDIRDEETRDHINTLLSRATHGKFLTPYIGLQCVSKTLANFHIFIPNQGMMEGDTGIIIEPVEQFGFKAGSTDQGQIVVKGEIGKDYTHGPHVEGEDNEIVEKAETVDHFIYFEYAAGDCGMFDIFCQIVDQDELDEILEDVEADDEEEDEEDELNEQKTINEVSKKLVSRYLMKNRKQLDKDDMPAKKVIKRMAMKNLAVKKNYPDSNAVGGPKAKVPATGDDYKSIQSVAIGIRKADKKK